MIERTRRRIEVNDVRLVLVGLAVLVVTWVVAAGRDVTTIEESTFRFFNDWPSWLEKPTWPVMQLGALAIVPMVAIALAVLKKHRHAVAAAVAGGVAWILAQVVKWVVGRGRPAALLENINLRTAWQGFGFVSGHATIAFALATVIATLVDRRWSIVVWALAVATGILRVYTGAHLPLDVIGGGGLGLAVGGLVRIALTITTQVRRPVTD